MKKKILFILILFAMFFPVRVFALNEVNLYLFWGDGCPHCEEEMVFLDELKMRYANLRIYKYETWYNDDNKNHLKNVRELYGNSNTGVPFTVIGDEYVYGFSSSRKATIEELVRKYSLENYKDKAGTYFNISHSTTLEGELPNINNDSNQNSSFNNNDNDSNSNKNNELKPDSNLDDSNNIKSRSEENNDKVDDRVIITLVLLIFVISLTAIYFATRKRKNVY